MRGRSSLALIATLCGCLDWASVTRAPEAAVEDAATLDTSTDVALDARTDVASDVALDARADVALDVALDSPGDIAADVARDAVSDAPRDAGSDVATDTATDVARDVAADVIDAATDVASDVRADVADVIDAADVDTCTSPRARCGAECVDLSRDVHRCGACDRDCAALAHVNGAAATCSAGSCVIAGACASGFGDCDRNVDNGCESQLTSDVNCGACGSRCGATLHCMSTGGPYSCSCLAGENLCDGVCMSLTDDVNNCGTCGNRCATLVNAVTSCASSRCVTNCYPGFRQLGTNRCVDFGGATVTPDLASGTTRCAPNPLTGSCACPPGFTAQTFTLTGFSRAMLSSSAQALTLCNDDFASVSGDWGGMMLYTTGGVCVTGNSLAGSPGACDCPPGSWDRQVFTVVVDNAGTNGIINTCTRRALSSTITRNFMGAYEEYVDGWHSPSGATSTCISGNPRATGCACPAGASSVAVRVMTGGVNALGLADPLSHAQIVFCMQ